MTHRGRFLDTNISVEGVVRCELCQKAIVWRGVTLTQLLDWVDEHSHVHRKRGFAYKPKEKKESGS